MGLVGLGAVGRAVRWRLDGLGMRVIAADPYADDATHTLDDLLARHGANRRTEATGPRRCDPRR